MGNEMIKFDPAEQLKKETAITERDFYEVYDSRHGRRKVPSARVYNIWAKEAGIKTRIVNAGNDVEKAWAHLKGWIGEEANPVLQREARVTIFWMTEFQDLVWNAIAERKDKSGRVVKKGKPYTVGPDGYPVLKEPADQLAVIQQLSRIKRFGERIAVTKAEAIVEKKLLGVEYRDPEEIKHEKQEVQAVSDAGEHIGANGNGDTKELSGSNGDGHGGKASSDGGTQEPSTNQPAGATDSSHPGTARRSLTKVVQINGKRVRTAGIEGEQLDTIWKAAEQYGHEKVAGLLKSFGVVKSTYLTKEEGRQVLDRLNALSAAAVPGAIPALSSV